MENEFKKWKIRAETLIAISTINALTRIFRKELLQGGSTQSYSIIQKFKVSKMKDFDGLQSPPNGWRYTDTEYFLIIIRKAGFNRQFDPLSASDNSKSSWRIRHFFGKATLEPAILY